MRHRLQYHLGVVALSEQSLRTTWQTSAVALRGTGGIELYYWVCVHLLGTWGSNGQCEGREVGRQSNNWCQVKLDKIIGAHSMIKGLPSTNDAPRNKMLRWI